jgi:hypothetical protein
VPSSLIGVLRRHCADTDSTCPEPSQLTCLADVLGRIPDPRRVRGPRYRLGSLLALRMVAVPGGATTLPSDSCAKQAGPTSPPQPITTGHAPSTWPPCSGSQPENASPLGRVGILTSIERTAYPQFKRLAIPIGVPHSTGIHPPATSQLP